MIGFGVWGVYRSSYFEVDTNQVIWSVIEHERERDCKGISCKYLLSQSCGVKRCQDGRALTGARCTQPRLVHFWDDSKLSDCAKYSAIAAGCSAPCLVRCAKEIVCGIWYPPDSFPIRNPPLVRFIYRSYFTHEKSK